MLLGDGCGIFLQHKALHCCLGPWGSLQHRANPKALSHCWWQFADPTVFAFSTLLNSWESDWKC